VFRQSRRLFWLEDGRLWTFSHVLARWWPVREGNATQVGGAVLKPDEVLEMVAQVGTPTRPRVTADAPMPCAECGVMLAPPHVSWFGARGPFCSGAHLGAWTKRRPVVDARSTRA
jgi:hypothetical protein